MANQKLIETEVQLNNEVNAIRNDDAAKALRFAEANNITDPTEITIVQSWINELSLISARFIALLTAQRGKSPQEIRDLRDQLSAETHRLVSDEIAKLDGAVVVVPPPPVAVKAEVASTQATTKKNG